MIRVLIIYHPDFASKGKFERKISRILSDVKDYIIIYGQDHQGLIKSKFPENRLVQVDFEYASTDATHAIVIDSESRPIYADLVEKTLSNIPVRYIKDKITFVSNKDRGEHFDVYCGRGTLWGNPYAIGSDGDRDEVIRKFKYDFDRDYLKGGTTFKEKLIAHRGKTLGCHCKPYPCHGDVLAKFLNELDDGE